MTHEQQTCDEYGLLGVQTKTDLHSKKEQCK